MTERLLFRISSNSAGRVSTPAAREFLATRKGYAISSKTPKDLTIRKFGKSYFLVGDRRYKRFRKSKRYTRLKDTDLDLNEYDYEELVTPEIEEEEEELLTTYGLFWQKEYNKGELTNFSFKKAVTILIIENDDRLNISDEVAETILDAVKWKTDAAFERFDFVKGTAELDDYPGLGDTVDGEIRVEFTYHDYRLKRRLIYGAKCDLNDHGNFLKAFNEKTIEGMRDVVQMSESLAGDYHK